MREFLNPKSLFGGTPRVTTRQAPVKTEVATSVTKDGDEPAKKPKRARGVSTQRSTLLTAGSAVGQETRRKSLLGVS